MIVNTALKTVAPFIPVAGSAYGFARTCVKVYNATSPTKALVQLIWRKDFCWKVF